MPKLILSFLLLTTSLITKANDSLNCCNNYSVQRAKFSDRYNDWDSFAQKAAGFPKDPNLIFIEIVGKLYISKSGKVDSFLLENRSPGANTPQVQIERAKTIIKNAPNWQPTRICNYTFPDVKYVSIPVDTFTPAPNDYYKLFKGVYIDAKFPGGINKWHDTLYKKMGIPINPCSFSTYAIIEFTVNKQGDIGNLQILNKERLQKKHINQILTAFIDPPKWIPAVKNGRNIEDPITDIILFP